MRSAAIRLRAILVAALVVAGCAASDTRSDAAPTRARYESLDGKAVDIPTGKPVVVNFFASWCTPCLLEMPDFERVHQSMGDKVTFIGVNLQEDASRAAKVKEMTAITYTIGLDRKGDLYRRYRAISMPATVILDAAGEPVDVHSGALTAKALEQKLADKVGIR